MTEGFCLFCGTPIQVPGADAAPETLPSHVEELYRDGKWDALLEYIRRDDTPAFSLYRGAAYLFKTVEDYAKEAQDLYYASRKKTVVTLFTGRSAFGDSPIHAVFHETVTAEIESFAGLVSSSGENIALGRKLSADVTRFFLQKKEADQNPVYWSLVACEHLTLPLLSLLEPAELLQIYTDYMRANPGNQSLPNQMKLNGEMRDLLKKQGVEPPKEKKFRFGKQPFFVGRFPDVPPRGERSR